jgi:hypothetical protein
MKRDTAPSIDAEMIKVDTERDDKSMNNNEAKPAPIKSEK